MENRLLYILKKWRIVLIVGILSVILGFSVAATPGSGFEAVKIIVLADYLAIAALAVGITYARRDEIPAWGWEMAGAVALFVAGLIVAFTPVVSGGLLIAMFATGFILEGISGISGALMLRKLYVNGWGVNLLFAVLTLICGIMLIFKPVVAVLSIDLIVAIAMISFGIAMIFVSYRLSKMNGALAMAERKAENVRNVVAAAENELVKAAKEAEAAIEKKNAEK